MARLLLVCALSAIVASCSSGFGASEEAGSSTTEPTADNDRSDNDGSDNDGSDNDGSDNDGEDDNSQDGDSDESGDDADSTNEPGPDQSTLPEEELLAKLGELQGQLAIGNGPQVAVARPDGLSLTELDGAETTVASQPTWSRDGRQLAWSSVSAERQVVSIQTFGDDGLPTGDRENSNASGPAVYYMQWNNDDSLLAYLRSGRRGRQVDFGTLEPGRPLNPIDTGAPFFISWSPSANELAANINQNSLAIIDQPTGASRELFELDGQFSAPAWIDDSTVLAVVDGWFVTVNVEDGSVDRLLDVGGSARFVLSPDRSSFAFQSLEANQGEVTQASFQNDFRQESEGEQNDDGDSTDPDSTDPDGSDDSEDREIPTGLIVVDVASGQQRIVTSSMALSWEWSPDSQKIAWMSTDRLSSRPLVQWNFWAFAPSDLAAKSTPKFRLPRKVTSGYLPFFAQYSQSVARWGPDSSAFAFAGIIESRSGIWMQLASSSLTTVAVDPQLVASGDFVTWGYGPTPEPVPSGGVSPS